MNKAIWLFLLILSLTACTEKIELPVPQDEPIPVLNSLIQPDSLITVYLSLSTPVLSDSQKKINKAKVKLFINGEYSETLSQISPGVFQSNQTAEIGKEYMLTADIPAFATLKAKTQIPESTEITDGSFECFVIYVARQSQYMDIAELSFIDPQEVENYYQIAFYTSHYFYTYETDPLTGEEIVVDSVKEVLYSKYINSNDPVIVNEGDMDFYPMPGSTESLVFSDELLENENQITFILQARPVALLRSISKSYYLFEKSRIRQRANLEILSYNPANFFLVNNPVDLHSNVENGLGIFAGYSETHYKMEDLTEYDF